METSHHPNALPHGYLLKTAENTYRIERVLGMGGFGITYLATTSVRFDNLKSRIFVAIKEHFISDSCERERQTQNIIYSNPVKDKVESSRKDFLAEARRLREVGTGHPNIVKVNGVFEANNTAYYVMEYLEGSSLRAYVKENGKLEEKEMLALMRPIIDAVDYLHKHRMTHLDIKPDNIMLATDEDDHVRPTLIDFGLSKHYGRDGKPTSTINTLGCSDGYAPIEQYGGITTFSPSADVYALGATMLFCLTGKDPKKSTEFLDDEKKALLASLPLSCDVYKLLLDTLHVNASLRKFPVLGIKENERENFDSDNMTLSVNSKKTQEKTTGEYENRIVKLFGQKGWMVIRLLLGLDGTKLQRIVGIMTMLTIIVVWIQQGFILVEYFDRLNGFTVITAIMLSIFLILSSCNNRIELMNLRHWLLYSTIISLLFYIVESETIYVGILFVGWSLFLLLSQHYVKSLNTILSLLGFFISITYMAAVGGELGTGDPISWWSYDYIKETIVEFYYDFVFLKLMSCMIR